MNCLAYILSIIHLLGLSMKYDVREIDKNSIKPSEEGAADMVVHLSDTNIVNNHIEIMLILKCLLFSGTHS